MAVAKTFNTRQFVDTPYYSAIDKAKFANDLKAFVLSGYSMTRFTKSVYKHLSNCYGHIAEFDRYGFYSVWFLSPATQADWVDQVLAHARGSYGDPSCSFSDVEVAFAGWLEAAQLTPNA